MDLTCLYQWNVYGWISPVYVDRIFTDGSLGYVDGMFTDEPDLFIPMDVYGWILPGYVDGMSTVESHQVMSMECLHLNLTCICR